MRKILITGATGQLGESVINFLLEKNPDQSIVALVRNPEKASRLKEKGVEVRTGDYNNPESLEKAFAGVDKVLFISGSEIPNRVTQHKNVVDALLVAKVKEVVYTSFQRKNETETSPIAFVAESHLKTEEWLKESNISYTILRNAVYMDMIPLFVGDQFKETGMIYLPAGQGKSSFVTRKDMAEAMANILAGGNHQNKEYLLANTEAYSFDDVAETLSAIVGKEIKYVSPSPEEYKSTLSKAGVPQEFVEMFAGFAEAIKQGDLNETGDDLKNLLGRRPVSLQEYLKSIYQK